MSDLNAIEQRNPDQWGGDAQGSGGGETSAFASDDSTLLAQAGPGGPLPGSVAGNDQTLQDALTSLAEATTSVRFSEQPEMIKSWTITALWRANVAGKSPNTWNDELEDAYGDWTRLPETAGTAERWIQARDMMVEAFDRFGGAARGWFGTDLVMRQVWADQELQTLATEANAACRLLLQ